MKLAVVAAAKAFTNAISGDPEKNIHNNVIEKLMKLDNHKNNNNLMTEKFNK